MNKAVKWLVGGGLLLWLYNKFATATALMKTNIEVVGFRFFAEQGSPERHTVQPVFERYVCRIVKPKP